MKFKNWLLRFSSVKLPIGDAARDVNGDPDFPEENNRETIFSYLESKHAGNAATVTFENAWDYYISEHGPV